MDKNMEKPVSGMVGAAGTSGEESPVEIRFDYIKSNFFRVVHADGVHGGVTAKGGLQVAFFSERKPLPKTETYRIHQGHVGECVGAEIREAIVREVEVEVLMNLSMAKAMYQWLGDKIESAEKLSEEGKRND